MLELFTYFITPSKRFFIGYLLSAAILAVLFLWVQQRQVTWRATKAYWLHSSARLDYVYFVLGGLIKLYAVMPLIVSAKTVMLWVNQALIQIFGVVYFPEISRETVVIAYTLTLFIVSDFSRYWLHRAMHQIPILWAFHKVHHSAEVLTPVTFYRVHPVENLLFGLRYSLVVGSVTGVFIFLFAAKVQLWDILGANAILFAFNLLGGNLRHSHIELAYPAVVEKWLISPRQHQLHHAEQLTAYNFGGYLAIWDTIFRTVKTTADSRGTIVRYGLGEKNTIRYRYLSQLLLTPFADFFRLIIKQIKRT